MTTRGRALHVSEVVWRLFPSAGARVTSTGRAASWRVEVDGDASRIADALNASGEVGFPVTALDAGTLTAPDDDAKPERNET